ncbi:MAG: hypothetical protein IT267_09965 [Saprospiraceae bacterium]|nr:hypothetical protein [Saprospiraceae bacterium]
MILRNNWIVYLLYAFVGIAALNVYKNYHTAYLYIPGDGGNVVNQGSVRPPGDGGNVANLGSVRPPGDGGNVVNQGSVRPPGGDDGVVQGVTKHNLIYLFFAIAGAVLGGWLSSSRRLNLSGAGSGSIDIAFIDLLVAFICSRAFLYICVIVWDLIIK